MGLNPPRFVTILLAFTAGLLYFAFRPVRSVRAVSKRPHFTNIAPRSKFSYISNNSYTEGGKKYFPQTMCGGVATFDFDNDGRMDLFFTNGAKLPELEKTDPRFYNCLLRNRGDGTFEDVTAHAGLLGKDLDSASAWPPATTTTTATRICSSATRDAIRSTTTTATAPSPMSPSAPGSAASRRMS